MASVLDLVRHYQHGIDKYPQDEQRVLKYIDKLFNLDVRVQHLQDTGVGRTVNALRKEPGEVGKAARALVYKWKLMVAAEESDQEADHNNDSTTHNGHEKDSYDSINQSGSRNRSETTSVPPKSNEKDNKQVNGYYSGSKRKYHSSEEEETETKKSKYSSSSENEDSRKKYVKVKSEPSESDHDTDESQSDGYDSEDSQSSEEDLNPNRKIKTEPVDKPERKNTLHNSHTDIKKTYSSSSKSHEAKYAKHHSSESSSKHSDKSSSKERTQHTNKEKSSKENDTKHKSENKSSDKDKDKKHREDAKSSHKHSSSDKHKSSSHKIDNSFDKHKSQTDQHKKHVNTSSTSNKPEKENHKSSSDKETSSDKHKSKDSSSSSKGKSSSSKERSKDKSSSSKEKSSSNNSDKKHSSSIESKSKSTDSKSKGEKNNGKSSEKKSSHKSSSNSHKSSKSSSSKSKENVPKKKSSVDNSRESDDGIDCGSGASFAEALGMITPSKSKKKSTPVKDDYSPNQSTSNDLSPATLLAPSAKLAPLPALEISALPEISPNYKPRPPPKFLPHFSDEYSINALISSKNQRTKVYSGNKVLGKIPTLYELCVQILQEHIDALEYTGGVPYEILKPVVDKATPQQLFVLEHYNPYLMEDTDHLWQLFCGKSFRNKQRHEMESWREMYMRCQEEQEHKLKSLTANIKLTQEAKKAPIKQTKMAYVDSVVKPPRNIARKQALHGTAHTASASPAARVAALASAPNVLRGGAVRPPPSIPGSSSTFNKPKKAPLMQKALQFMRGRKR